MGDNPSGPDLNFSVAEDGYTFNLYSWNGNVDRTGDGLSYSDPDSPWSSFAPDTPLDLGVVTSDMSLTSQGSLSGSEGDHPEENQQNKLPVHQSTANLTIDPIHIALDQIQATYNTGAQDSGSYINTQACSFSPFLGVGPPGPLLISHPNSTFSFEQSIQTCQGSNIPLSTDGQDFNQYGSVEVAGAHPPCYASSA